MKAIINSKHIQTFAISITMLFFMGCERDIEELETASYSANPDVFIDGFSAGLEYAAFGGSVPAAFNVDNEITYNNSSASMRVEVPGAGDPRGAFAGGVYFTSAPRDLSGFNALTFWAKASQPATLDLIGFGNDLGESRYQATISDVEVNTNWKKYIIPIPDPSKLTAEKGMFFYSEGPEDDKGYTFWIDELQFENLGSIAHPQFTILNGENLVETSFNGVTRQIDGLISAFNLPTGINQEVATSYAYYNEFSSSDPAIASVDQTGKVTVLSEGTAVITATIAGEEAEGSLTVDSKGNFQNAPTPTQDPEDVISIYTEAYPNVPVNYYNGYWEPFQTTLSEDFEVNGDFVLNYTNFNFVGIEFSSPTIDATDMTHFHLNIYLPNPISENAQFLIKLVDLGDGGEGAYTHTITQDQTQQWITIDIPLSSFGGLSSRNQLYQIIFEDLSGNINNFYADNIYFYK